MEVFGSLMAFLTLGTGAFLTVRLGLFQFTHLLKAISAPFAGGEKSEKEGVTAFRAMATALGGSVGTANIAGVAGAIITGGPGAVFWMWAAGLLGMATKAAETALAIKYRDGSRTPSEGGPMVYIVRGMGRKARPLAVCYASFGSLAALIGTALVQSNTIAGAAAEMFKEFGSAGNETGMKLAAGAAAAALTGAVILGGAKRIGAFCGRAVPLMAAVYCAAAIWIVYLGRERLPMALESIVKGAFGIRPALGGATGYGLSMAVRVGVARGVYSNEAGVGTGALAHAGSIGDDPMKEALLGIFEVFADTMVVCTLTALAILTSGAEFTHSGSYMGLAGEAFALGFGEKGSSILLFAAVTLFSFTSLVGWELYGEICFLWLTGGRGKTAFRTVFLALIPLGAIAEVSLAWRLGEVFNYLMALPNLFALILLSGKTKREAERYKMFEKMRVKRYNKV